MEKYKYDNYEVVEKENIEFNKILNRAWAEIGIDAEYYEVSDYVLVKNPKGKTIGTFEVANYDKGNENEFLEALYPFSNLQENDIQLVYVDKIVLIPTARGEKENLKFLLHSLFEHLQKVKNGKPQRVIGLMRTPFYECLQKLLNFNFITLGEEIDGETPMMFEMDEDKTLLQNDNWINI